LCSDIFWATRRRALEPRRANIPSRGHRTICSKSSGDPHYAEIVASRRSKGRPIQQFDALIAAIARLAGAPLATRDVDGFADCDLTIINPWNP
jgi:hypothetical protein